MPVFGGGTHERSGDGEDDDGRADNGGSGQHVGHSAIDDKEAGEDVGESRAGENLVLDAQAGIVPVTLPTRILFAPGWVARLQNLQSNECGYSEEGIV